jgi:hypothetical protein
MVRPSASSGTVMIASRTHDCEQSSTALGIAPCSAHITVEANTAEAP